MTSHPPTQKGQNLTNLTEESLPLPTPSTLMTREPNLCQATTAGNTKDTHMHSAKGSANTHC
jgi:hypothetical protein